MIHSGVAPLRHRAICTFPNGAEEGASRRSAENFAHEQETTVKSIDEV